MLCWLLHGKLARDKPQSQYLTTFYLSIAFGGMLGGIFNSLLAPMLFNGLYEYPIAILLGILLINDNLPDAIKNIQISWRTVHPIENISKTLLFAVALGIFINYYVLFIYPVHGSNNLSVLEQRRSFFGVYKILETNSTNQKLNCRILKHGSTNHGAQFIHPAKQMEPVVYYALTEPVADIWKLFPNIKKVAVIGLGTGGLAAYSQSGEEWDLYEIDPLVKELAESHFTYLKNTPANTSILIGDGRLKLAKSHKRYDLIFMDAFNSDSVPVHLLSKEAYYTYRKHLAENGLIVFNISNRYLDLEPVIKGLADLDNNYIAFSKRGSMSKYAVISRKNHEVITQFTSNGWHEITKSKLWTDDFSNVFLSFKAFNPNHK